MRFSLLISLTFLLNLFACDTPSEQENSSASGESSIVKVADVNAATPTIDPLIRENLPPQRSTPNQAKFEGSYFLPDQQGYDFSMDLIQKGDSIMGAYCGYTDNRSDCGMPSQGAPDCIIKGVIRNDVAYLAFMSCYMGKMGQAELKKEGQNLIWNTTLFPENDGGIYFCAAPDSALLLNENFKFDSPARFSAFGAYSARLLVDLPEVEQHYIFSRTNVLHSLSKDAGFQTYLPAGTPFEILKEEGEFTYTRIGDELFDVPAYKIEYEQHGQKNTGYIHHESIAYAKFEDSRGNLFLLGLDGEEDLRLMIKNHTGTWQSVSTGLAQIMKDAYGDFPLFKYELKTLPELTLGDFSFLKIDINNEKRGTSFSNVFSWNGDTLASVLPIIPQFLPKEIDVKKAGNQLELNFKIHKQAYSSPFYESALQTKRFIVQDAKLVPLPEKQPEMVLAYLGKNNEFTFPDSLEKLKWQGVRVVENELVIEPLNLDITKEEAENEMVGKWTKKNITTLKEGKFEFIISGLPQPTDTLIRKIGQFSEGDCQPRDEKIIEFSGTDWRFTALGKIENNEPVEFSLLLTGTKNGKVIEQYLHFSPFREMPVEFLWTGDLDGDQLPDFIINVDEKGISTDTRLYLSGSAESGNLVKRAGEFYSNMPGC